MEDLFVDLVCTVFLFVRILLIVIFHGYGLVVSTRQQKTVKLKSEAILCPLLYLADDSCVFQSDIFITHRIQASGTYIYIHLHLP